MSSREACDCSIRQETRYGLPAVRLENGRLRVTVLVGKGADVYEILHVPTGIDVLAKTPNGLEALRGRDLTRNRLTWYSEVYGGGWQDCLPHRGVYRDVVISQENGGIAATLPWAWEREEAGGDSASIRCIATLPDFPLYVERVYRIARDSAVLQVQERIRNQGDAPMSFTWTQHAVFGGRLLEGRPVIELPDCRVFHPHAFLHSASEDVTPFEEPPECVTLDNGEKVDLHAGPPVAEHSLFRVLTGLDEPAYTIRNPELPFSVRMRWELAQFPFLRLWSRREGPLCLFGLEPSNDKFASFEQSRKHGTCLTLAPGEDYAVKLAVELNALPE